MFEIFKCKLILIFNITIVLILTGEDAFLASIVSEVNGAAVQFKLAPTYTLYMATRYRISKLYRPDISPQERAHRLTTLVRKIAIMVQQTVQVCDTTSVSTTTWHKLSNHFCGITENWPLN